VVPDINPIGAYHGDDGETDFLAALEGRLHRRHAFFDMAIDVLEHDNGVVDHEPDRQHHRQQGQRVHGEAQRIHDRKRAEQRRRNGHHRNKRRPETAQEEEHHQDHQQDGFADGPIHRVDRCLDEDRGVVRNLGPHSFGKGVDDRGQLGAHALRDIQRIGDRLLDDTN
jgi:hypothetical protein